jgi:hypothetical protein
MSEYQFHEFRTVNRILTKTERADIDTWSSRQKSTSTGAKYIYNYGSFKRNPEQCLLDYFDMMLHHTNYGSRRIMFKFPEKLVNFKALKQYQYEFEAEGDYEHTIVISKQKGFVVVDIEENLEEGYEEWIDCEDTLGGITSLWTDIVNGDYRCLYLAWVHFAQLAIESEVFEEDIEEPPVPAGLQKITGALSEFAEFWWISEDLITASSKTSPVETTVQLDFKKAIDLLSDAEKSSFLLQFAQDEPQAKMLLIKRLEFLSGISTPQYSASKRTIQDILESETKVQEQRAKLEKEEADAKRHKELQNMAKRQDAMWTEVYKHLDLKISSSYDKATQLLVDLKDVALFLGKSDEFKRKLTDVKMKYGHSATLTKRFVKANL